MPEDVYTLVIIRQLKKGDGLKIRKGTQMRPKSFSSFKNSL